MAAPHAPDVLAEPIPTTWTLLLIGGFGAECFVPTIEAFSDAAKHLDDVHHVKSLRVPVTAFGSSEQNAVKILDFITTQPGSSKFIVVAHSKGAADVMVALASYPAKLKAIKAVITIAGAVGGSWLADDFQKLNDRLLKTRPDSAGCDSSRPRGDANGIDSMRREVRQKFLATNEPTVPAYSISAVSTEAQMSRALKPLWRRLRAYAREQDSHIVEREAIVPWGSFLGRALGDHWAVAMPVHDNPAVTPDMLKLVDQNRYPRIALIEAAVRIVTARLPAD
jgi:pimeloyl-ACP methyl ester carboxylesterase